MIQLVRKREGYAMHCFRKAQDRDIRVNIIVQEAIWLKAILFFTIFCVPSPVTKILQYADTVIGIFVHINAHTIY